MTRKDIATLFIHETSSGHVEEVFNAHVCLDFIHHNIYFKGDRQSLIDAMTESAKTFKDRTVKVFQVLEEKDMVMTHSHIVMVPGQIEVIAIHIFKFVDNKIVEMWDITQLGPEEVVNENGLF